VRCSSLFHLLKKNDSVDEAGPLSGEWVGMEGNGPKPWLEWAVR
jgi:hypothetical protein